jgi:hypothetical protein
MEAPYPQAQCAVLTALNYQGEKTLRVPEAGKVPGSFYEGNVKKMFPPRAEVRRGLVSAFSPLPWQPGKYEAGIETV